MVEVKHKLDCLESNAAPLHQLLPWIVRMWDIIFGINT